MANPQNIIPNSERTPKERKKIASKGGQASGVARRRKKAMREVLDELLLTPAPEDLVDAPSPFAGIQGLTVEQAVLIAQIAQAIQGDTKAAIFIRDTAGQKILKDMSDNTSELEDDGFAEALKKSTRGVWADGTNKRTKKSNQTGNKV
ncbi:MAG: hypothetical protein RR365_12665 [Bacteroides sp.]